jgi:hypothetical protein
LLEKIVKEKRLLPDLKKMSLEQDSQGFTPFLSYYKELKNTLEHHEFSQILSWQDTDSSHVYAVKTFIPETLKTLKSVNQLYST